MENVVYLSLGSNLGDRAAYLAQAIAHLRDLGTVTTVSSLYETEPVEFTDQPWFLNSAVELITSLSPQELIAQLLRIEQDMGRRRTQPKGPRVIDIDILLFGDTVVNTKELTIPHPALHERSFVLEPLAEIAPQAVHPQLHKTIAQLRLALPPETPVVRRLSNKS